MIAKLTIQGVDVTSDTANLDQLSIFIKKDEETATVGEQLSDNLIVTGDSYYMLKDIFFANCDGFDKLIPAKLELKGCGGLELDLFISAINLEDDPTNCEMRVPFRSFLDEECCFRELAATEWYSGGFVDDYDFPLIWYCDQPSFLQAILIYLRFLIISVISLIPFLIYVPNIIKDILRAFDNFVSGAGRIVPAVLIREVLEYQINKCGLQFSSSIYQDPNSPYYNEVILYMLSGAYFREEDSDNQEKIIETFLENVDPISTTDLLDNLALKYNAKYEIINGILYFEQEEFFENTNPQPTASMIDASSNNESLDNARYRYNQSELLAGIKLSYTSDALDQEGGRKLRIDLYKKYYSFAITENEICKYNPNQFGTEDVIIPFGACRFMQDADIDEGTLDRVIDEFRQGKQVFGGFFINLLGLGYKGIKRYNDLVVTRGLNQLPKLLILSDNFDTVGAGRKDAQIKREIVELTETRTVFGDLAEVEVTKIRYRYQEDQHVEKLYDRYHQYRDPSVRRGRIVVDKFEFPCSCQFIMDLLQYGNAISIVSHYGMAKAEEYEIVLDPTNPRIIANNITVFCG